MTSEDRLALTQRRRERYNNTPNTRSTEEEQHSTTHEISSFNDPVIVNKITEFYNDLTTTLEMKKCSICSEQFPNLKTDSIGSCKRCSMDKHIPKVYSALNNMHPGPVPSELSVSITLLNILINKFYYALCYYITFDITVLHLLFGIIGIITSRRNVNLTHHSHDVSVSITTWTIWVQWPCGKLTTRCSITCKYLTTAAN